MRLVSCLLALLFLFPACGGDEPAGPVPGTGGNSSGNGSPDKIESLGASGRKIEGRNVPVPGKTNVPDQPAVDTTAVAIEMAQRNIMSRDPEVALEAIQRLREVKGEDNKRGRILARALDSEDSDVRAEAARTLGLIKYDGAIHALRTALVGDEDDLVRKQAALSLHTLAPIEVVDAFVDRMSEDDSEYVRATVVNLLGKTNSKEATKAIIERLKSDSEWNDDVLAQLVVAIGNQKASEGVDAVVGQLMSSSAVVRTEAAKALGKIGNKNAVPKLMEVLDPDEEVDEVLAAATEALGILIGLDAEERKDMHWSSAQSEAQNMAALKSWKDWWADNKGNY